MNVEKLKEGDLVQYIDSHSIARKGTVQRNKTTENKRLFLTVKSESGVVEVIQDSKKVIIV